MLNVKKATDIAGTIGNTSKMPGLGNYGLPAADASFVPHICTERGWLVPSTFGCPIGSILANVKGSTCSGCYADERGNYTYPSVQIAQTKRVVGVHHPQWVDAMVFLLERKFDKMYKEQLTDHLDFFFCNEERMPNEAEMRDLEHLANLECAFFRWHDSGDVLGLWHLDKIYDVVERTPFLRHWLPTRETALVVKNDRDKPSNLLIRHSAQMVDGPLPRRVTHMSGVTTTDDYSCHAPENDNECGSCRKCWDEDVEVVIYHKH